MPPQRRKRERRMVDFRCWQGFELQGLASPHVPLLIAGPRGRDAMCNSLAPTSLGIDLLLGWGTRVPMYSPVIEAVGKKRC